MPSRSLGLLLLCFFLSGLSGLVYQTAWTRQFTFVFGTSELAVASVLAAYMGGLAVGAAVVLLSPRGEDAEQPLVRETPATTPTAESRPAPAAAVSPDEFPTTPLD